MSDAFPFAIITEAFPAAEIDQLVQIGDKLLASGGTDLMRSNVDGLRHCQLTWIGWHESARISARIGNIARSINDTFYQFDLHNRMFPEAFQYAVYQEGDHFDWHIDKRTGTPEPRKLSLSIQLSDPSEYEGGEIELKYGRVSKTMIKERGAVIAFPSWTMHRVLPVTKGIRKSLVAWCCGPHFR